VKRFFFLLNAAFAMAILDLISRVHLAFIAARKNAISAQINNCIISGSR
jgi:hypothetical protein